MSTLRPRWLESSRNSPAGSDGGSNSLQWWRRRESKPEDFVANGRETSPNVASDENETTFRDEPRRAIAKPPSPRAALIAALADQVRTLALVGDLEAARVASDAIARLLGAAAPPGAVVDLLHARQDRRR